MLHQKVLTSKLMGYRLFGIYLKVILRQIGINN